jgi:hypothetical protein
MGILLKTGHGAGHHDFVREDGKRRRFHDCVLGELFNVVGPGAPLQDQPALLQQHAEIGNSSSQAIENGRFYSSDQLWCANIQGANTSAASRSVAV